MAIKNIQYPVLEQLIVQHLSTKEWPGTVALIREFREVKKRGWLTKDDLIKVCYWKSPRAINYIKANTPGSIKEITARVLNSRNEASKIADLTQLKGVSVPMASSLLTLVNPKRYGVMDIRVWELLYHLGAVNTNPRAANFKHDEWLKLLEILRYFAEKLKVTARDVERTLFLVHKKYQEGTLYGTLKKTS